MGGESTAPKTKVRVEILFFLRFWWLGTVSLGPRFDMADVGRKREYGVLAGYPSIYRKSQTPDSRSARALAPSVSIRLEP